MFLKRAFFSLRHHWKKVLAHTLAYTVLFSLCFGALVLFSTARGQLDFLQGALGRSVTLRGGLFVVHQSRSVGGVINPPVKGEDIARLAADEAVEGWNSCDHFSLRFEGCSILYPEERARSIAEHGNGQVYLVGEDGMQAISVRDSARSQAFLLAGLNLVEGEHFSGDDPGDICLISQEFADANGLAVGDTVTATNYTGDTREQPFSTSLTITGIFESQDSSLMKGVGGRAEEMVVVPFGVQERLLGKAPTTRFATFYLKQGADEEAFLQRVQGSMNVLDVVEDFYNTNILKPPAHLMGMSFDEMMMYEMQNPDYLLQIDKQWYDMVAKPLEQEVRLAGAMAWLLTGSVALILALIVILAMKERRREIGILLSMGEGKGKVIGQMALEAFAPILLALAIGVGVGTTVGVPLAEGLCNGIYTGAAEDVQKDNDAVTFSYMQKTDTSYDISERQLPVSLIFARQHDVEVYPQAVAQVDSGALMGYMVLVLGAALLALLGQSAAIVAARPAKILLNRR